MNKRIVLLGLVIAGTFASIAWGQVLGQRPGVNSTINTMFGIPLDGSLTTYGAGEVAISPASATATDIFEICGSATKTVQINKITFSGHATAVTPVTISILKRSTAAAGGTYDPVTPTALDSNSATATATLKAFSLNPTTLGTLVGSLIATRQYYLGNATTGVGEPTAIFRFGARDVSFVAWPLTLRSAAECVALSLNGGGPFTGNSINLAAEWTEF